jgi:hypothetical protein
VRSRKTAQGALHALEWTRTTTGKTPNKALNPIRAPLMDPAASRSSSLCASQDASDASDGATFVRLLSRAPAGSGRSRCRCGVAPSIVRAGRPSTGPPCLFEGRRATQRAMLLPFVPSSSEGRAAATLAVTRKRHRKSVLNAAHDPCCDAKRRRGLSRSEREDWLPLPWHQLRSAKAATLRERPAGLPRDGSGSIRSSS